MMDEREIKDQLVARLTELQAHIPGGTVVTIEVRIPGPDPKPPKKVKKGSK